MKIFIFCGGFGTRMNSGKPGPLKPLLKIHGKSIIEYIFDIYNKQGFNNFYLLGGYKIKELTKFSKKKNYNITVINSGKGTPTGGRLLFAKKYLKKGEVFFLTYGDSLANFKPIQALKLKKKNNFIMSTYDYKTPYGVLNLDKNKNIKKIYEKNFNLNINAGFYIFDTNIFKFIKSKNDSLEINAFPKILNKTKLFKTIRLKKWQPIDNIYDIECVSKILKKQTGYFNA